MILSILFIYIGIVSCGTQIDDLVDPVALNDQIKVEYTGKMYSGYLDITEKTAFHYYFMTDDSLAQAPVILWLNGGPGCSSLQGAFNENGPFVFEAGTANFKLNEYAWTKFASMIYLESPAGVGFSYGDTHYDDDLAAKHNLIAVQAFFERFPEYANNDFYISGESYAGVYIPLLASEILNSQSTLKFKGIAIGNACTDETECGIRYQAFPIHRIQFAGRHGLLSDETYQEFRGMMENHECDDPQTLKCMQYTQKAFMEAYAVDPSILFNPYNVYGRCWTGQQNRYDPHLKGFGADDIVSCTDSAGLYDYLRRPEFRQLTHITDKSLEWEECSKKYDTDYTILNKQSYYIYPKLIQAGLKILIFSGDVDAVVPITGTLFWLDKLQMEYGLATLEPWRPWYVPPMKHREGIDSPQNAGNVWVLDGITFVSVRNAGHMVPTDKPQAAMIMMNSFIKNTPL